MAGVKLLRKIILGKETTAGTAIATTTVWRGTGTLEDQREVIHVDEDIGYLGKVTRTNTPKLQGAITTEGDATFEQLIHIMNAGVKSVASGSTDTGGSGKIWAFPFPTTTPNTIKSYTIEGGDNQQAEEMEYSFVRKFSIQGAGGEPLKVSADWLGRQITPTDFTTSGVTVPTVETINFGKGKLYIDAITGTQGTTQITNSFIDMTLNVNTGWQPVYTGDGNKYFSFPKCVGPEIMLDVTFEHDTTGVAQIAAWRAETAQLVRVIFTGSAVTAGATYASKALVIDLAGKIEKVTPLKDADGNDIVTVTYRGAYDSTASKFATITVVNLVSTLP